YKLRLHCRSLGLERFAQAFDSADRLLLAHWNAQTSLPARAAARLRELGGLLLREVRAGRVGGDDALYLCELALLRQSLRHRRGEAFQARVRGGKENGQDETPASAAARIPLP